ncbi:MAG: hypothetical protein KDK03_17780 [Rhodobacteraceae bacterium]|nr:hypothetical protein [Paracoccaceae bacterium]
MQFLGASIIAGVIFFVLNYLSSMVFGGPNVTNVSALVEAVLKTAVFVTIFHYLHNFVAKLFHWYRTDDPDARHTFDRNPALDEARAARRGE